MRSTVANLLAAATAGCRFHRLPGISLAMLLAACAWGEFRPYQMADFEDGRLPESTDPFGVDISSTLKIANLPLITSMPPDFRDGIAAPVVGSYGAGIQSKPDPEDRSTHQRGFSIGVLLDRDKLGANGRALYQADFYLPPTNVPEQAPCIAILALDPTVSGSASTSSPMSGLPKAFYRFGISRRKTATLYFSCVMPGAETAPVYEQDTKLFGAIPRPGWHRFAMLFTGNEEIRCYLDGKEPRFSPIKDSRLRKLKLGVMLADALHSYECYVDNLTILWSMDDSPLPPSPFVASWANVSLQTPATAMAAPAVPAAVSVAMPSLPPPPATTPPPLPPAPATVPVIDIPPPLPVATAPLVWLEPAAAWAQAQKNRQHFLLFFFSPADAASARLDGLLDDNLAARTVVQSCSKAKVDVTRQTGLDIAKGYKIPAVPTMIIFTPDGSEVGRATFTAGDTWESFAARLGLR